MTMARFCIVVPTFQADGWLDQCLNSIFSQAGPHRVRLHLQDGGSSDATLEIAERWRALTETAASPFSRRLTMTIDSGPDGGLYDAVSRGFETLDPEAGELMTWLNADDLLAPGALSSVASCLDELPEVSLVGGRVSMIDADGRVVRVNAPVALSQKLVAAGCHDGRRMPFVMQEGTFWRQELWSRVGGLNAGFRLAGDWDLWRRMAKHSPFVTLDVLTAFHRRRPGQLSENLDAYYAEVDRHLTGDARAAYDIVYANYIASGSASAGQAFEGFEGPVAQLDRDSLTWSMTHRFGERLSPAVIQSVDQRAASRRGGVLSGAKGFEGPYPEWDLPGGVRWITDRTARLTVPTAGPGRHQVRLTCRPGVADLSATIRAGEEVLLHAVVDPLTPVHDQVLTFDLWSVGGAVELTLETATPHGDPENRLLVVDIISQPLADPVVVASDPDGAHVAVVCETGPQGLARTLASLQNQSPRPSVTVISPCEDLVLDQIASAWRQIIRRRIIVADPGSFDALAGPVALVLRAGIELQPGRLADVLQTRGAKHEVDGRAVRWLRPASAIDGHLATPGAGLATDRPLSHGGPEASLSARPRLMRLLAADQRRDDTLGRVLSHMDADLRILTIPAVGGDTLLAAELKSWRPDLVMGSEALLGLVLDDAAPTITEAPGLLDAATAADRALAFTHHPRQAARALFGLDGLAEAVAVMAGDAPAARAAVGPEPVLLTIGAVRPSAVEPAIEVGAGDGPTVLSWAMSAADRLWASNTTPAQVITAAQVCALPVAGIETVEPAPLDAFARAMLAAASEDGSAIARRALRFRALDPVGATLSAGPGAVAGGDGLTVASDGLIYLTAPAAGAVRLRVVSDGAPSVIVSAGGDDQALDFARGKAIVTIAAPANQPVPVRIRQSGEPSTLVVSLASGASVAGAHDVAWEPQAGFGREEAAAPDIGLHAPFRWIEGRRARIGVLNDQAGWRRLLLRLRTLQPEQKVLIRAGGRMSAESLIEGGDLAHVLPVEAVIELPEGWSEIDLRFITAVDMPDRSLAAILDGVEISPAEAPEPEAGAGWQDLDGFDFEEPAVPQYGLEQAFRWRLPGARIAVRGERAGPHHVVIAYRTALPGQTLTARSAGRNLARNSAETGRLDIDERLAFTVDLGADPLEIALDADRYMEGDRPLGFIIQSVSVNPTL